MAKYTYTHFIPENIAPQGSTSITAYCNGQKVCSIPLGRLAQPKGTKNYSFLAISDIHVYDDNYSNKYRTSKDDFRRALGFAEESSECKFVCICGDLTSSGSLGVSTEVSGINEMQEYADIVNSATTKPVYAIAGNHETSWGNNMDAAEVSKRLLPYTGFPLYYSLGIGTGGTCIQSDVSQSPFKYGDAVKDVYIMVGHYGGYGAANGGWSNFVSHEELQWLYQTLELNRDKRCLVFNHVYPHEDGVGDANRIYNGKYWSTKDNGIGQAFVSLLKHYKNTILFHGHSHLKFEYQADDIKANYSSAVGYKSVHIPSLAVPRISSDTTSNGYDSDYAESEGYVVDVYDDYIILNGRDFVDNDSDGHIIPIATYKIDTPIQTVAGGTFADSTGLINTTNT